MNVVADASVAVKWLLPPPARELDSDRSIALLDGVKTGRVALLQPVHWLAEVAAVLSRLAPATASQDVELLHAMRIPVLDTTEVYANATALAIALGQHVFDTLYHAVALLAPGCTLVTADERYFRKARSLGSIMLLRDWHAT